MKQISSFQPPLSPIVQSENRNAYFPDKGILLKLEKCLDIAVTGVPGGRFFKHRQAAQGWLLAPSGSDGALGGSVWTHASDLSPFPSPFFTLFFLKSEQVLTANRNGATALFSGAIPVHEQLYCQASESLGR